MRLGKFARLLTLVAPIAVLLAGCSKDPTDEGSGDPFALVTDYVSTTRAAGTSFVLGVKVIDRHNSPLQEEVTVTTADAATVAVDSVRFRTELAETRAFLRAIKASAAAGVTLTVTGGGLTQEVKVIVN